VVELPLFPFLLLCRVGTWSTMQCDSSVHLAVQFLNPVIVGLDNGVVHELLHCVHLEFLGELGYYFCMLHPQGKSCIARPMISFMRAG
jgi:hypothetical protein